MAPRSVFDFTSDPIELLRSWAGLWEPFSAECPVDPWMDAILRNTKEFLAGLDKGADQ